MKTSEIGCSVGSGLLRVALAGAVGFLSTPAFAGVEGKTWSGVKELYRSQEPENAKGKGPTTQNERDRRVGPFPGGDWSSRVVWEARFALSRNANGTSGVPIYADAARTVIRGYYGDWDYVNSDSYAKSRAIAESWNQYGTYAGGYVGGHYCGGTCTWFVRDVLYRSTYWAGYGWHLTTPGYPSSVWSWTNSCCMTQDYASAKPGYVLSSPYKHMAIAESRGTYGGQPGWWVIDSNFNGGEGHEWIGKHFMSDTTLRSSNYWAWAPTWATTN